MTTSTTDSIAVTRGNLMRARPWARLGRVQRHIRQWSGEDAEAPRPVPSVIPVWVSEPRRRSTPCRLVPCCEFGRRNHAARWSDHNSSWDNGYDGIQITDTGAFRSPSHTRPDDTIEKIDFVALARITFGMYGAVIELSTVVGSST